MPNETAPDKMTPRSNGYLDLLKGCLISLVIFGHILPEGGFSRYIIYSFHMPLFLSLSGFLLTRERVLSYRSIWSLLSRYWNRMMLPWLLAFGFFEWHYYAKEAPAALRQDNLKSLTAFIGAELLYPNFHLWFVPALLFSVIALRIWLAHGNSVSSHTMYFASLAFTLVWTTQYGSAGSSGPQSLWLIGDKRWLLFFPFFIFGFLLRNFSIDRKLPRRRYLVGFAAISVVIRSVDFLLSLPPLFSVLNWLALNITLAALLLTLPTDRAPAWSSLRLAGIISLPLYLWHPLVFLTWGWLQSKMPFGFVKAYPDLIYQVGSLASTVVFGILIYILRDQLVVRRFFLGRPA